MEIGLIYPQTELGGDPEAVRRIGVAAEALGYDHLLAYDHMLGAPHDREPKLWGPYTDQDPFHDPFVMFAYLAGITTSIELVSGVLILPQRQTVVVARQAADLDLLSGRRFRLGVGIGWNYVEYDALGEDFHSRGKRLDEQVALLRRLWEEPLVQFEGRFDRVDRAALNPQPASRIPIWMGGFADAALARAARLSDGFIFADGVGDSHELLAKLRVELERAGRADHPFGLQLNMLQAKTPEAVVETVQRWADAGGSHVAVNTMGKGMTSTEDHLHYAEGVAAALGL